MSLLELPAFLKKSKSEPVLKNDIIPDATEDGSVVINAGGRYVTQYAADDRKAKYKENIKKWRKISKSTDLAAAISDIVGGAIVNEENKPVVRINFLGDNKVSTAIRTKILEEFDYLLGLLNYNTRARILFEEWYIDGSQYIHKVVDPKNLAKGILKTVKINPLTITPVKAVQRGRNEDGLEYIKSIDEYFTVINTTDIGETTSIKLPKDSVSYIHSGQVDEYGNIRSFVENAVKPTNQLTDLEDSTVIYNVARAPQTRVFYVDIGNLPKSKAESYMNGIITKFKNKMVYDSATGKVKDGKHIQSMIEDIWLPRKEGSKSTEISTIEGGGSLDNLEELLYFRKKVYKAQQVPTSRLDTEGSFSLGRATEISRDELKFSRFLDSLRVEYSRLFFDLLKTQIVLKNIASEEEWAAMAPYIEFIFNESSYFTEIAETEMMTGRLQLAAEAEPYVGKYYSHEWIRKNILKQTESDIKQMDKEIKAEESVNQYEPKEEEF